MLPKNLRLEPKDIPEIARRGKRIENTYFITKVWFDDSLQNPVFAISISTRVDKKAVVRSRIKRRIRAVIVEIIQEFEIRKAKYLFIVKSKELKDIKYDKLKELISEVLRQ